MKQRTVTVLALFAAIVGALLGLYQGIVSVTNLARLGVPVFQLILQFLAGNDWIGFGFILLFFMILFVPRAKRLGAAGVIGGALIRIFFSLRSLIALLAADALQMVGSFRFFFFLGPLWALTVLVFGIFWAVDPDSRAARIAALAVGLNILVNLIMTIVLNPFEVLMVVTSSILLLMGLWFLLHFLRGSAAVDKN